MSRLPSIRVCIELFRLRRRLPRLIADLPLDELLKKLANLQLPAAQRARRATLDRSVLLTEAVIRKRDLAPDGCLFRALSRFALLRANGTKASFRLALNAPPESDVGHAWVEDDGRPYLEEIRDGAFVVTFTYPQ